MKQTQIQQMPKQMQITSYEEKKPAYAISEIVEGLWAPLQPAFKAVYDQAKNLPPEELFKKFRSDKLDATFYSYGMTKAGHPVAGLTLPGTAGCPWKFSNDGHISGGCSMCNYHSEFITRIAEARALMDNSPKLYARAISESVIAARKKNPVSCEHEIVTAYDTLDPNEFPKICGKTLFGNLEQIINGTPKTVGIEVRADTLVKNEDYLKEMSQMLKAQGVQLSIEMGVEVGDGKGGIYDFVRNGWLNKGIDSAEVAKAIELAHKYGCVVTTNVVMGMPGLTEEQSKDAAVSTILWLDSIGADHINCLPLNRKRYTLQHQIYKLGEDKELNEKGLVYGEHTGVAWLYTTARALTEVTAIRPEIKDKLNLSQISPGTNSIENTAVYNADPNCHCTHNTRNALAPKQPFVDYDVLKQLGDDFWCTDCHEKYTELLERQKKAGSLKDTLETLFLKVSRSMFNESKASGLEKKFKKELKEVQ